MAKFVTRTTKSTEVIAMVCNTKNGSVEDRILTVPNTYKSFERGTDGFNAVQTLNTLKPFEVVCLIKSATVKSEKRKITMEKWLEISEPCDGTEDESESDNE